MIKISNLAALFLVEILQGMIREERDWIPFAFCICRYKHRCLQARYILTPVFVMNGVISKVLGGTYHPNFQNSPAA